MEMQLNADEECGHLRSALLGQYEMMKNGELCDFNIIVEGCVFPVHKVVLASRSPYFRTLFSSSLVEAKENLLELDDIELDVFHSLLKYVYTCEFDSLSKEDALKLIMHGEKYGLKDLVDDCENYLLNSMDIGVAVRCLLAGDLLERKKLKSHALSLLQPNWEAAFSTDGWNDVVSNHSLMTEIEKIECCSKIENTECRVGIIKWDVTTCEVKWLVQLLTLLVDVRENRRLGESHAFSLLGDGDMSWRFCISYSDRLGEFTVALSHFGPPALFPLSCSFAVSWNTIDEICTGTIDTSSCCFLQNPSCQMVLATFSIRFHRLLLSDEKDFICVTIKKAEKTAETSSMNYLSEYLENSSSTDATIKVGGEEFSIHKTILSAASPIFMETFRNQGSLFELNDDMDPETFRTLLLIIYHSQGIPSPINFDLIEAAKRYKLSHKQINRCRAAVFRAMKDSHLIDFLIQADAQQDPIMKLMAFKQMAYNFEAVTQSDEWTQMSNRSDLHDEFFKFIVSI